MLRSTIRFTTDSTAGTRWNSSTTTNPEYVNAVVGSCWTKPTTHPVGDLGSGGQDEPLREGVQEAEAAGQTAIYAAWDGQVRGVLVACDTVKPTSAEAVAELRALGLRPVLLTGDNPRAAAAVAAQVGIGEVIAGVLPAGKVEAIRQLQHSGRVVAMAGDGVNDAAAVAQSDLGLAMGTGTDAAIEASDLTLVRGDLRAVPEAIALSRRASEKAVVEAALRRQRGVILVEANPVAQTATVRYDPAVTSVQELRRAVERCGYECAGGNTPGCLCDPLHEPAEPEHGHNAAAVARAHDPAGHGEGGHSGHSMDHADCLMSSGPGCPRAPAGRVVAQREVRL